MNKKKLNTLFNISFMILLALTSGHISMRYYETHRIKNYWADNQNQETQKEKGRFPSSLQLMEGSPETENLLSSYFQFETYNKYLNYELEINFRTNKDDEYILRTSKQALKEALSKTLVLPKNGDPKESIAKLFKEELMEELIQRFVKTLKLYKIVNGSFQIDLNFKPKVSPHFNFNEELSSNQLIRWDSLSEHDLELGSIHHTVAQKALSMSLPYNHEPFQYKGGQITLWFKLVDLKPDFEIRSPKERAARGFIRYRKYFRAPHLLEPIKLAGSEKLHFDQVSFKASHDRAPYVTVDIYQDFDLKHPMPKLSKAEFHFGKLLEDNFHRDSLFSVFHKKKTAIKTGELVFSGHYKRLGHSYKFKSVVESLIFDFKKGDFKRNSKIKTQIKSRVNTPHQKGRLQNEIFTETLHGIGIQLIEGLKLGSVQYFQGGQK